MTVEDPLDDIPDANYKKFIKDYIKEWPYPPQTQYRVGQIINAELNGVQERCEVQVVDCSLIQVFFKVSTLKPSFFKLFPTGFLIFSPSYVYLYSMTYSGLCVIMLREISLRSGSTEVPCVWNTCLIWGSIWSGKKGHKIRRINLPQSMVIWII